jgi:decaprenylphospho-beta-D-ribofuranose 2-oxidase
LFSAWEAKSALLERGARSVLGRGAARSYGDAALNASGLCLDFTPAHRFLAWDAGRAELEVEAGVTLEEILQVMVPRGYFLPVTPGTKYPTIGGSVACDVHGKSKHSISFYTRGLTLLLADGNIVRCSAQEESELFWATVGGMGLTGAILSVRLALQPIPSSWIAYDGERARDLGHLFAIFESSEKCSMTVAWVDCVARGRHLGRSIMMRGEFAALDQLRTTFQRQRPHYVPRKPRVAVPLDFPSWSLNTLSVSAFNTLYYAKHPQRLQTIMDYDSFFYPLDSVLHWNRIYGRPGLVQYQFLVPLEQGFEGIKTILEKIVKTGRASFLAVLKKFTDPQNQGLISFPTPGYFLALDFPVADKAIFKEMQAWDELVLKFGGRIYLAKDARMQAEVFAKMYSNLKKWLAIKNRVDPKQVFSSDLGRRLGLSQ